MIINGSPAASLADLTSDEVRLFTDLKLETLNNLMLLEPNDFDNILGNDPSTFIKRMHLVAIGKYLRRSNTIDSNTLMAEDIQGSYGLAPPLLQLVRVCLTQPGMYLPLQLHYLPVTSHLFQEIFRTKIEATLSQTICKHRLSRASNSVDKRDDELQNVFKNSLHGGTAYYIMGSALIDAQGNNMAPSGHRLWQDFLVWCNFGARKDALISKLKSDIKGFVLDGDHVNGFDYVSQWINSTMSSLIWEQLCRRIPWCLISYIKVRMMILKSLTSYRAAGFLFRELNTQTNSNLGGLREAPVACNSLRL